MKVSVLGCRRRGTFLAWYAASLDNEVYLWDRPGSNSLQQLSVKRENEYLKLQDNVIIETSLPEALDFGDTIIISYSIQAIKSHSSLAPSLVK